MPHETLEPPSPAHNLQPDAKVPIDPLQMLSTYGIPIENLGDLQGLASCNEPIAQGLSSKTDRRKFLRFLGISGAMAVTGMGFTAITLFEHSEIPDTQNVNEKPVTSGEPIGEFALSFLDQDRVYISTDELHRLTNEENKTVDIHVEGSDMKQYYRLAGKIKESSGIDIVERDGFEFVRFTLRPTDTQQYICSMIASKEEDGNPFRQPVEPELQKYQGNGATPIYSESQPLVAYANELQRHFDMVAFLFPGQTPYITIRDDNNEERTSQVRATNQDEISPEIPLTDEDLYEAFSEDKLLEHFNLATKIFILRSSLSHGADRRQALKTSNTLDYKRSILTRDHYKDWPENWSILLKKNIGNFIFHPAAYSDEVNGTTELNLAAENILASLFYLLSDDNRTDELLRKVNSLSKDTTEGTTSTSSEYNDVKAVIGTLFDLICAKNYQGAIKAFPQLQKMYDKLNLDTFMQFQLPLAMHSN